MTLQELMQRGKEVGDMFSSWDVPVTYDGEDIDIRFEVYPANDGRYKIRLIIYKT